MTGLRSALWLPIFDELADPRSVAHLAAEAEAMGWPGVFVWDHLFWRAPVRHVADPWITLAAIAAATEAVRLGPMVTPLARRRPAKAARETATLDSLTNGRLTLGVGLGSDRFANELSKTGEQLDDRRRGQMLDEALEILTAAWSGEPVQYQGEHFTVDGVQFLPKPVQRPGAPVWVAGFPRHTNPLRRAAHYDGFFPVNLDHPDQLAEIVATINELRPHRATPYDIAIALPPGADPAPYFAAGATWWLTEFTPEELSMDRVRGVLATARHRPPRRRLHPPRRSCRGASRARLTRPGQSTSSGARASPPCVRTHPWQLPHPNRRNCDASHHQLDLHVPRRCRAASRAVDLQLPQRRRRPVRE